MHLVFCLITYRILKDDEYEVTIDAGMFIQCVCVYVCMHACMRVGRNQSYFLWEDPTVTTLVL